MPELRVLYSDEKSLPYMRMHRTVRLFSYLHQIQTEDKLKCELLFKASLMHSLMSNTYMEKFVIEGATLSYIPYYCKKKQNGFNPTKIAQYFGQNTKNIVLETKDINDAFIESGEDECDLSKFSAHAKEVFLFQSYLDTALVFSGDHDFVTYDGKMCQILKEDKWWYDEDEDEYIDYAIYSKEYKNGNMKKKKKNGETYYILSKKNTVRRFKLEISDSIIDYDGEKYPIHVFHQYLVENLEYKIKQLSYVGLGIREAIRSLIESYRRRNGFAFKLDEEISYPNAESNRNENLFLSREYLSGTKEIPK